MTQELSPEAIKAIDQIQKLLNLAAKAGTPEEGAAAAAKAQELLAKYNLSAETVEDARSQDGRREAAKVDGGAYAFQRKLWRGVAELNFCIYWTQRYATTGERVIRGYDDNGIYKVIGRKTVNDRMRARHAVVGRLVNVRTTIAMATYLQVCVERLTVERIRADESTMQSRWAFSFREGVAMTVVEKLEERRAVVLDEEEKAERDAARAAAAGASSSTALTVAAFTRTEKEANLDFIHGEGYSARRAAQRAKQAKHQAEEEEAYAKWAAANPEEVRRQRDEERKREERNAKRRKGRWWGGEGEDKTDWGAYRAGREAGASIGIDQQAEHGAAGARRIGR